MLLRAMYMRPPGQQSRLLYKNRRNLPKKHKEIQSKGLFPHFPHLCLKYLFLFQFFKPIVLFKNPGYISDGGSENNLRIDYDVYSYETSGYSFRPVYGLVKGRAIQYSHLKLELSQDSGSATYYIFPDNHPNIFLPSEKFYQIKESLKPDEKKNILFDSIYMQKDTVTKIMIMAVKESDVVEGSFYLTVTNEPIGKAFKRD
jgi:hypothetical protein